MFQHLRANLWLLVFSIAICCVAYPAVLWGIGQLLFRDQANGSLIYETHGNPIGSRMIAQPFTADEYFQPRPSSVSYNASASGASNWAANNPALRNRVARQLGPIVKYAAGAKKGQLAAGDIEAWFQKDEAGGKPGIVAQWAVAHSGFAQAWVGTTFDAKNPTPGQQYVLDWAKANPDAVAKLKQDNPDNQEPAPADLAVVFFEAFSKEHPGKFPAAVTKTAAEGKSTQAIEPVGEGTDIESTFFDMWLNEHPDVALEHVPADMVMASGSGLDPDITLDNALWQLDRVAVAWAKKTNRDEAQVRGEIEKLLRSSSSAPLGGAVGVPLINVLETNLALHAKCDKG